MRYHPCVAHTLNLCIQDAIKSNDIFNDLLKKCRSIVGYFKHSVLASEKLRQMKESMRVPQLKVKQDVATLWNSALIMERLVEIKTPLSAVIATLPNCPTNLSCEEWEIVSDCKNLLT